MASLLIEQRHYVKGIDPIADVFAGATVNSDVVDMSEYGKCLFVVYIGVGATGSSTFTVEACDDIVPTNVTAIPFYYRQILTGDTEGTLTRATAAGFVNTVGSSKIILIEVDADDLVSTGYRYVRLDSAESVDSPVLGGVLIELGEPRYRPRIANSAID